MNRGDALNRRVWKLFEKAGFVTKPNSQGPAEYSVRLAPNKTRPVDLFAEAPDLEVSIIGSNKSGRAIDSWTDHVNGFQELARRANATKALFVLTGKESVEEERSYVKQKGMALWDGEQLDYYEAVADAIKSYAKYEIIHALGIRTEEEKDGHRVLAVRLHQPTTKSAAELYMFTLTPERLLRTCIINRRAQGHADAYQRMLRKGRLPDVRKFVTREDALLPTNVILHLSDKVAVDDIAGDDLRDRMGRPITLSRARDYDLVTLNIPMEYASLELIDGQHRLYGFVDADPATRQNFNLVVIGVKGLSVGQRRDTFIAINDNSRRMDANLVAYLKYTEDVASCQADNALMAIRVVVDLNGTTPFRRGIKLLDVGAQKITLKGFAGYDLRGLLGPKGLLRKYYPANEPGEYVQVLRMFFSKIRSALAREWNDPDKYIVATNRGVSAFLKLLKSILKTERRALLVADVDKYMKLLRAGCKTWEFAELKSTYVGSQGWKQFHRDLVKVIRKKYPTFRE